MRSEKYVVVGEGQHGELVELYRAPSREVAKAVATGIRNAGVSVRQFSLERWQRMVQAASRAGQ